MSGLSSVLANTPDEPITPPSGETNGAAVVEGKGEDAFDFSDFGGAAPKPAKAAEAPAEEEAEEEEPAAAEEPEETSEEPEEGAEEKPEAETVEAAAEPAEISPEAEYVINGEKVTGQEILDGRLMRQDYTKKTTELAEARKAFEANKDKTEEFELEVKDLFARFDDPQEVINEFSAHRPEVWKAIQAQIIDEALKVGEMSERELGMYFDNKESRLKEWARTRAEARNKMFTDRRNRVIESTRIAKDVTEWRAASMKKVGLKLDNQDHLEAVYDAMVARHRGKRWTAEMFDQECARVAKALGVKAPKPEKPAKPEAKAAEKPKLPAVKATGTRRPATTKKAPEQKRNLNGTFAGIRSAHGIIG